MAACCMIINNSKKYVGEKVLRNTIGHYKQLYSQQQLGLMKLTTCKQNTRQIKFCCTAFCCTMLYISATYSMAQCLSACHVRVLYGSVVKYEDMFLVSIQYRSTMDRLTDTTRPPYVSPYV